MDHQGQEEENVFAAQAPEPAWTPPPEPSSSGQAQMGNGNDADGVHHVASSSGTISNQMWTDSAHNVAAHLTQTAHGPDGGNDEYRCGASALLGGAVMNGQAATAAFIENATNNAAVDDGADDHRALPAASVTELHTIAGRVLAGTASFEDLNRVQELLYTSSRDRHAAVFGPGAHGLSDANEAGLAGRADPGATTGQFGSGENLNMDAMVASLQPGQSAVLRVGGSSGSDGDDHFITVGRQPDGTPYVYNPDPSTGDHDRTLVTGQAPNGHGSGVTPQLQQTLQHYMDRTDANTSQQVVRTPSPAEQAHVPPTAR
jgi:hypothetical protein